MQENIEIWKDVVGYEGLYQVSNLGNVKSLDRIVFNKGISKFYKMKGKKLSTNKSNGSGYKVISLNKDGISKNYYTHRLVAEAFVPNENLYPQVNHKDENKYNNNSNNLEWCTCKYNNNYGTARDRIIKKLINNKYRSKQVSAHDILTNELVFIFPSINEASRQLKCSGQNISDALHGKQPTARGYIWKYL